MKEYKRLGDYIREVNVRNRNLKVTKLVGLTIDKAFIPSVANVIGTDLSTYKVIRNEQFACSLMQVSRDGKMPIAMFEEDEAIMSPAYPMFEVVDKSVLLPQYLMMWFSRSEFDREASYYAVGGVRGSLTWEDFCNMQLPIPSITRQREIVAEYETLKRRIQLNEQMIQKLESTAQTLYRKMFVDGIDKENLPEGWRMGTIGDIARVKSGYAFPSEWWQKDGIPVIKINNIHDNTIFRFECDCVSRDKEDFVSNYKANKGDVVIALTGNVGKCSIVPEDGYLVNQRVGIFNVDWNKREYLYLTLFSKDVQNEIQSLGGGSVQINISATDLEAITIILPSENVFESFHNKMKIIFEYINVEQQLTTELYKIQSLFLAKMGK